jgi:hypothetical protein
MTLFMLAKGNLVGNLFIGAIVGFGLGLYFFFKGFKWWRLKCLINNLPTSKVRSIAMGLVEVYGRVVPRIGPSGTPELLKSPLTNHDCVYYRYKVEELSQKSHIWTTIKVTTYAKLFYLEDETGQVIINPDGAEVDIFMDNQFRSGSPVRKAYLESQGFRCNYTKNNFRYSEWFIEPGDYLYIMGTAAANPLVDGASVGEGYKAIMIKKNDKHEVFYISDRHERNILNSLFWRYFGGVIGGGLLTITCLIIILTCLGFFGSWIRNLG